MKNIFVYFVSIFLLQSSFAEGPDFEEIFRQIKTQHTATESIKVRHDYLDQMRNLYDFDRLTDLEKIADSEEFFDHYRKDLGSFVLMQVDRFMLDKHSDLVQDIFARNIVKKAFDSKTQWSLLDKGLYYVEDCEDFRSYARMSKAPSHFLASTQFKYCYNDHSFGNTFELISNVTLNNGEYKTIYLPTTLYVSKLYISVEGLRSDAYFDVMVNGDIKGTIYVPGRDPLYIINVADSADQINLRSMYGSARILSIKVEYK